VGGGGRQAGHCNAPQHTATHLARNWLMICVMWIYICVYGYECVCVRACPVCINVCVYVNKCTCMCV